MAISYSHKFGQIIGDSLEKAIEPHLREFALKNNLYLDIKGKRITRKGTKLTWNDINNNKHDLDFVMEKGGSDHSQGIPVAFIECAWRRYTKHSRNKAQEIQGAIIPLFQKYKSNHPFIGVILAGEFTKNSISQLESLGFSVLFFDYEIIINAFKDIQINAFYDETTSEKKFQKEIEKWESATEVQKKSIYSKIAELNKSNISLFLKSLEKSIVRKVTSIKLLSLFGEDYSFLNIKNLKKFLIDFNPEISKLKFIRFEAIIEYSNGDQIKVDFKNNKDFVEFLEKF